jgi:hypothetical protein
MTGLGGAMRLGQRHGGVFLALGGLLLLLVSSVRAQVVINELHYDPDVKTERVEYVELYNAGAGRWT